MLFKDYFILENALKDPDKLVNLSKLISFYRKKVSGNLKGLNLFSEEQPINYRGFRSQPLDEINYEIFQNIFNNLFTKILGINYNSFSYNIKSFLHFSPSELVYDKDWWHTDTASFAGVIYLNKNPPDNSGTILLIEDKEVCITNEYNKLVFYKSNILHRPQMCFGDNVNNCRLTLSFFVNKLEILN